MPPNTDFMATIEFEQRLKKGEKGLRDALAAHMDKGINYADVRDFIHDVRQILMNHELSELFQTGHGHNHVWIKRVGDNERWAIIMD